MVGTSNESVPEMTIEIWFCWIDWIVVDISIVLKSSCLNEETKLGRPLLAAWITWITIDEMDGHWKTLDS